MNTIDILLRLLAAAAFCGVIGIEREMHRKPAGLRTNILIGMGSALFTIASLLFARFSPDPGAVDVSRVASQILPGIGFLGAGSIIQARGSVQGLTTAATIWVVSAIGVMCGLGEYKIAVIATILAFVALVLLRKIKIPEEQEPGAEK